HKGMEDIYQDIWTKELFEYLKFISKFDLTNPFIPQSGQFQCTYQDNPLFCRFSLLVNKDVQTGVLRILNTSIHLGIEDLTDNQKQVAYLKSICQYRQGLVISIGPTNSGKTTTLHAILHEIALQKRYKIVSLEDPIEIEDPEYLQLQINEAQGFTYEKGIEELLRHDPDIIFIGETRNAYTAKMVIRAALTGHLVFTTLHAKNGLEAILRLQDFGIPLFDLKTTLTTLLSQRLYHSKGGKTCIYEILSKQEIQELIENKQYPKRSRQLYEEIEYALASGNILDPQAEFDYQNLRG
ncbi:MAG: Flp pilus assembly complex ATPase component TadA, partial [Firmicutes bacterium]|nr:Flp pilus assembly complex ATPase component TadA [Bacillota bacterium]